MEKNHMIKDIIITILFVMPIVILMWSATICIVIGMWKSLKR